MQTNSEIETLKKKRIFFLFFFLVLCRFNSFSQELGRLTLTYQNHTYKTSSQQNDYLSSSNSFYLNFWQDFLNLGSISFSMNYNFSKSTNQIASYSLNIKDVPISRFKVNVDYGHISYPISSLHHFGSFNTSHFGGLKGGKIVLRSKKTDLIFFGGQVYKGFYLEEEKTRVYGIRGIFRITDAWTFGSGWFRFNNVSFFEDGNILKNYDVLNLDTSLRLARGFYFLGDVKYMLSDGDQAKNEFSFKGGTYFRRERLLFEIYYNYVSPNFPYLGSFSASNRNGMTITGQYSLLSRLFVFASHDTFNENLEQILERPVSEYKTYRYGITFSPETLPQISLSFNKSKRESTAGETLISDNTFNMIFLSISKQYERFYWGFNYNSGDFINSLSSFDGYCFNRFHLNLRMSYPEGHFVYINSYYDIKKGQNRIFEDRNLSIHAGGTFKISSKLLANLQLTYNVDKDMIRSKGTNQLGFGGSITYNLWPLKINCSLRYQYSRVQASQSIDLKQRFHKIFFSITKNFTWGKRGYGKSIKDIFHKKGQVKGYLFIDMNQNNIQDPVEETLEGVEIFLDGRKAARTNKKGYFKLPSVSSGVHNLSVNLRNVPAYYEPSVEKSEFTIERGKTIRLNLSLIPLGLISGKLVLDLNENGRVDKEEPLLADIQINLLKNGELYRTAFTNSKGIFYFDNVRPGLYTIQVDEEGIKGIYTIFNMSFLEISIKPFEEKKDIKLLVKKFQKIKVKKILD